MKHPIYLALTAAACAWLLNAHTRGINPLYSLIPMRWGPGGPSLNHK